jgi:predicted nucleotidyltransferase
MIGVLMEQAIAPARLKRILQECKRRLAGAVNTKLADIMLFGSYARNEGRGGSDIDLIMVLNQPLSKAEEEAVSVAVSDIGLANDVLISCLEYPADGFREWDTPFLMSVRKEGVRI